MMKGKLMKSLFRGKATGIPRTPARSGGMEVETEDQISGRLRLHSSEENQSTNSLNNDSTNSDSPRSWPSTFATPMSYIKERKKRKVSKFQHDSPYEGEENVFGTRAEEHNLSASINSETASFVSFLDSPRDEELDGAISSKTRTAAAGDGQTYQVQLQQMKLQIEIQQKMISDYEAAKAEQDTRLAEATTELERAGEQVRMEVGGRRRLESVLGDLREKLVVVESENRSLQQQVQVQASCSPLTDHQKELLLQNRIKSCSAPPSIMAGSMEAGHNIMPGLLDSGEELSNEWEVKSSGGSSVHSEVSVACLQDKLVQMEENNYSTHEELQATLQELTDLQHQLEELQQDNRTLGDEKALLYESLCQQTDKLEACRSQLESTRQLLLQKEDSARMDQSDKEKKLLDVLKAAQDERDRLDVKSCELANTVEELRNSSEAASREMSLAKERMGFLERTLHTVRREKEHGERELQDLKSDISCKNMELARLGTLNENFKTKLEELEAARDAVDKTEIEAKLDELRREKDGLEGRLGEITQQRDKAQFEAGKLKDASEALKKDLDFQIESKEEQIGKLEEKIGKLADDKSGLLSELQCLQNSITELEVKCQHHLTDKRELRASLSEVQKFHADLEGKVSDLESQLSSERTRRVSDAEEWKQFQADLLMTVRVANDFQTEAQSNLEVKSEETKELRERVKLLEVENERLKKSFASSRASVSIARSSVAPEVLRSKYSRSQSENTKQATVKGIIDSIESAAKAKTAGSYTRSASTPSMLPGTLSPIAEVAASGGKSVPAPPQVGESGDCADSGSLVPPASPPAAQPTSPSPGPRIKQQDTGGNSNAQPVGILSNKAVQQSRPPLSHYDPHGVSLDPLAALVKNGGSKRNALLKWCQGKTQGYLEVDITNFSSSWNDGMAFCALLHGYIPDKIPYSTLKTNEKRRNFTIAFDAAEAVGIPTILKLSDMVSIERPDWQQVMTYVTNIYKHFET